MQQTSLKALARKELTRNTPCNNDATNGHPHPGSTQQTAQQSLRRRLADLADTGFRGEGVAASLPRSFLQGLIEVGNTGDDALRALLSMLADDVERRALRRPKDDTAAILCQKCGPVWVHPTIAAVLPVVDGWPRALGCPWCFIHPAGCMDIPRPREPRSATPTGEAPHD